MASPSLVSFSVKASSKMGTPSPVSVNPPNSTFLANSPANTTPPSGVAVIAWAWVWRA